MRDVAVLALDSATEVLCVAACNAAGRSAVWSGAGGALASQELLARVLQVLEQVSLSIGDVQAIGFGRGPGAFTGLRSACAAAQGLAFGIDRPVVPVDSLLIVAEAARRRRFADAAQAHVGVVMDARMAELYAARYAWRDGLWTALQPPGLWSPDALEASWRGSDQPDWWAGSGLGLVQPKGERGESADDGDERARALLRLTVQGLLAGQAVPAREALPLYLRDKVALTTAERAAAASLRDAA